jgi:hypothetical protein
MTQDPLALALEASLKAHGRTHKLLYWALGLLVTILIVKSAHLSYDLYNSLKIVPENRATIIDLEKKILCYVNPEDANCKHTVTFLMQK